jgi:hypothetical protein
MKKEAHLQGHFNPAWIGIIAQSMNAQSHKTRFGMRNMPHPLMLRSGIYTTGDRRFSIKDY